MQTRHRLAVVLGTLLVASLAYARVRPPVQYATNCVVTKIQDGLPLCAASGGTTGCQPILMWENYSGTPNTQTRSKRVSFTCDNGAVDVWMAQPIQFSTAIPALVVGENLHAQLFASRNLGKPFRKIAYWQVPQNVSSCQEFAFSSPDTFDDCSDRNDFWEVLPGMQDFNVAMSFVQ